MIARISTWRTSRFHDSAEAVLCMNFTKESGKKGRGGRLPSRVGSKQGKARICRQLMASFWLATPIEYISHCYCHINSQKTQTINHRHHSRKLIWRWALGIIVCSSDNISSCCWEKAKDPIHQASKCYACNLSDQTQHVKYIFRTVYLKRIARYMDDRSDVMKSILNIDLNIEYNI